LTKDEIDSMFVRAEWISKMGDAEKLSANEFMNFQQHFRDKLK